MSVNSSSNSSLHPPPYDCMADKTSFSVLTAYVSTSYILLFPLIIPVVYVGYKRWRKQRSVAATANMSHFDVFTYNMVVMELIGVLGTFLYYVGSVTKRYNLMSLAVYFWSVLPYGQTLFHLLTCVDRYLAVVHPVTYLRLRQRGGVRIRNISIVCVWLLCFGTLILMSYDGLAYSTFGFVTVAFCVVGVSFCSISVLCVLIRPGPGEVGGNRERADQSKLRAFHTVMAILGALMLRFLTPLFFSVFSSSFVMSDRQRCLVQMSFNWLSLPSSLVLPLLFLQRAGKLPGCKHNTKSG